LKSKPFQPFYPSATNPPRDTADSLPKTLALFQTSLALTPSPPALALIHRLAQLIGTRAARLTACGIAAICKKQKWTAVHVGADGSLFIMYPHFKQRQAQALKELFGWGEGLGGGVGDPVEVRAAEDGSGVGAALIAALTIERVKKGNWAGIRDPEAMLEGAKRQEAKMEEGKAPK
jgi:hexokinase